ALAVAPTFADDKAKADPTKKPDATKKADVHLATVKVEANAGSHRVLKKTAIAHKPFEMEDPKTKKKYKPDDLITGPGGKKMKASQYFAQMNGLEKKLNEIGHSMRHEGKTTLVQTAVNKAELDKKAAEAAKQLVKFDPKTMRAVVKRDAQEKRHLAAAKQDEARVAALKKFTGAKAATPRGVAPKTTEWGWSPKPWGNTKVIAVGLYTKVSTSGSTDRVQVRGEAGADGYLHGHKQSLIKATGV